MAHSSSSKPLKDDTPPQIKRKSAPMTENEKIMIFNAYKYVQKTWPTEYPMLCKTEIKEKTACILGIAKSTVYSVLKEYKDTNTLKQPAIPKRKDDVTKTIIKKKIQEFHLKGETVTRDKIVKALNADKLFPKLSRTTYWRIVKDLDAEIRSKCLTKTVKDTNTNKVHEESDANCDLKEENRLNPIEVYIKTEKSDIDDIDTNSETSIKKELNSDVTMENPYHENKISNLYRTDVIEDCDIHRLDVNKVKIEILDIGSSSCMVFTHSSQNQDKNLK